MVHYSTNWMGPIATRWYEERNIPYVLKKTKGVIHGITGKLPVTEYKEYTESYSGGRIDIYGLSEEEHWGGKSEYGLGVMKTEDWNTFSDFLDDLETEELVSLEYLFELYERDNPPIRWWKDEV